jgi:hypothetical protein
MRAKNNMIINPFSTEPVSQITLFFTCSNMGALICNYLLDEASNECEFSTMNRQDGHLQFEPKRNNLRSYTHGQLRLEQAKLGTSSTYSAFHSRSPMFTDTDATDAGHDTMPPTSYDRAHKMQQ